MAARGTASLCLLVQKKALSTHPKAHSKAVGFSNLPLDNLIAGKAYHRGERIQIHGALINAD